MPPGSVSSVGPKRTFRRRGAINTAPVITLVSPHAAPIAGGITITITGSNFYKNSDGTVPIVLIAGVFCANVVFVSSTQLTCTAPQNPTSADALDVEVICGTEVGFARGAFAYYDPSVILRVVPANGPLSGSTAVVLEGYNFREGSLVYFGGVLATSIVFIDAQHIACVTPPHAVGFVDVSIVEPT